MIYSEVVWKIHEIWQYIYLVFAHLKGIVLQPHNFYFQIKYQNLCDKLCVCIYIYRAFHDFLRDYKHL